MNESTPTVQPDAERLTTDQAQTGAPQVNGTANHGVTPPSDSDVQRDLDIARQLAAAGIPVFVAYPDPEGETKSGRATGYALRKGWENTAANPAYVDAWRPGRALVAVMGYGIDLADTDPRNGGDPAALNGLLPDVLGAASSPSDGLHLFVRSMGVRSRDSVLPGIDVKAGTPDGGRGFAFIAPTVRVSKTTGELRAYRWLVPPDLSQPVTGDPAGSKLAELVRQAHGSHRQPAADLPFQQPASDRKHAGPIPYGEHHSQLVAYAGWLRARNFPIREARICMLNRLGDLVQPADAGQPRYTEAEALAELHDVYDRYTAGDAAAENAAEPGAAPESRRRLVLTPASAIAPEPVVWAWEDDEGHGRIPAGSLGLFAGREGTGKSSFLIWMTARITSGKLRGSFGGQPRAVIYVAVEDSWKYTIVPRLMAAGADLKLVYRAEVQAVEGDTVSLSLPADNKMLEEAITSHGVAMVALDPLMSAISDSLDTHVNRQVRQALEPLARLADRTGALIAGIAHFNKSSGTDASSLITASGAFKDVARFIFGFATDPEDGSQVITQTKNSLGLANLPSFAYRISEATVDTAKGPARVGRLVMEGVSQRSVQDILSVKGGEERDEKSRAEDFLKSALANGPRPTREVLEESKHVHAIATRTLERARLALHLKTAKRADGWWLSLPEHEGDLRNPPKAETASPAKTAKSANPSFPGELGGDGGVEPPDPPNSVNIATVGGVDGVGPEVADPPPESGPCTRCHAPCNRYGPGGGPLCDDCRAAQR